MPPELYGRPLDQAVDRLGSLTQAVAVESSTRTDGPDAGARRIRLVNGPLEVEVLPDRGLDLAQVRAEGVPLAWLSSTGFPPLSPGDADGRGWLRGFGGGLLTTCGLLNVGPAQSGEEQHPMHGRYSSLRATVTRAEATRDVVVVEGIVREATVFGDDLELHRRIELPVGERVIRVDDRLVNRGRREAFPMVLYHVNLGWPLVDAGTRIVSPAVEIVPRDAAARAGLDSWDVFPELAAEYPEQVFRHVLDAVAEPGARTEVRVVSGSGIGVRVGFDPAVLPGLFQWRVAEPGQVVLGIEPATAPTILGRADALARGLATPLAVGEERLLGISIAVDPSGG
jgi:hypothetical protein